MRLRRPRFTRTLSDRGMRTLIAAAVVALLCARVFSGA